MTNKVEDTDRLLRCVLGSAPLPEPEFFRQVEANMRKEQNLNVNSAAKRIVTLALAAVLLLAMSVTAYAVYQARIGDYVLPEESERYPELMTALEAELGPGAFRTQMSLVGYQGTPEYEAYAEWTAWLASWNSEHPRWWLDMGVDDAWHETPDNYAYYYSASLQEQAEKLDEIAAKYGLTLHTERAIFNNGEIGSFYDALGVEPFIRGEYDVMAGYFYDDGTFKIEALHFEDNWNDFTMFLSAKGAFSMISGPYPAKSEGGSYTTAAGVALEIAAGNGKTILLAETEGAYIYVCVDAALDEAELEAFTDTIDFAALAKRFDGRPHEETARKTAELARQQAETNAAETAEWLAPFSSVAERDEYVLAQLGDLRFSTAPEGYAHVWTNTVYGDGTGGPAWGWPTWFDSVCSAYNGDGLLTLFTSYQRYYTDETRSESNNAAMFEQIKAYYAQNSRYTSAECSVAGYEGYFTMNNQYGPSDLYWLDTDRDLIFSVYTMDSTSLTAEMMQELLLGHAETLVDSLAQ